LTYFQNGKNVGTPFTNVEGKLYFIVEACHHGSYTIVQDPKLPEED